MVATGELGNYGEEVAAAFLEEHGLVLLARNWRCREGELDIVAQEGRTLVFCEVKTRSGVGYGLPAEAVSPSKARRLRRLAAAWLHESTTVWPEIRFDVVSVIRRRGYAPVIEHLRAAF
jgi:putative endonuclease